MRVIALLFSPRYQLFSEATPRKIVGTEGTICKIVRSSVMLLLPLIIILNNCAIQNSIFSDGF
jgi:hypothetical protein